MSSTAPGWFPDPYGRHTSRYWDGGRWTEHVSDGAGTSVDAPPAGTHPPSWGASGAGPGPSWGAPAGAWSPAASVRSGSASSGLERVAALVALGGAALLLVAAFLPWFSVDVEAFGTSISDTVSGVEGGDGVLVIVLALVAAALALPRALGRGPSLLGIGVVVVGLLALLIGVLDLGNEDVSDFNDTFAGLGEISPDVGLFAVIVGGLVVTGAGALMLLGGRRPG